MDALAQFRITQAGEYNPEKPREQKDIEKDREYEKKGEEASPETTKEKQASGRETFGFQEFNISDIEKAKSVRKEESLEGNENPYDNLNFNIGLSEDENESLEDLLSRDENQIFEAKQVNLSENKTATNDEKPETQEQTLEHATEMYSPDNNQTIDLASLLEDSQNADLNIPEPTEEEALATQDVIYGNKQVEEIPGSNEFNPFKVTEIPEAKEQKIETDETQDFGEQAEGQTLSELPKKESIDLGGKNESYNEKQVELLSKTENTPFAPMINSFVEQGLLQINEAERVKDVLTKVDIQDTNDIIVNLRKLNNQIEPEKIEQIIDSITYIEQSSSQEKFKKTFLEDFKGQIESFKTELKMEELSDGYKDTLDLLGANYFPITSPDKDDTKQNGLNRAFNISINKLTYAKDITKNHDFIKIIETAKSSTLDFSDRLKALKQIKEIVDTDQGSKGSRLEKGFKNAKKIEIDKTKNLNERFKEFQELVQQALEASDKQVLEELEQITKELKEEAENAGDIFVSAEIDEITEQIEKSLKEG